MKDADPPPHDNVTLSSRDLRILEELADNASEDAIDPYCNGRRGRRHRFWLRFWFRRPRRTILLTIGQLFIVSSLVIIGVAPLAAGVMTSYVRPTLVGLASQPIPL